MLSSARTVKKILWLAGSLFILVGGVALFFRGEIAERIGDLPEAEDILPEKLYFIVVWTARFVVLAGFFLIWSLYFRDFLAAAGMSGRSLFAHIPSRRITLLVAAYFLLVAAYTSQYGFFNLPAWLLVVLAMGILMYLEFSSEDAGTLGGIPRRQDSDAPEAYKILGPLVLLEAFVFLLYSGGVYQTQPVFVYLIHALNFFCFCLTLPYMKPAWRGSDVTVKKGLLELWDRTHFILLLASALAVRIFLILSSPDPQIDVFFVMQQSAQGLIEGKNPYSMTFGPEWYGKSIISYLPATIYLAIPARVLLGDVRYTYALGDLIAAFFLYALVKRSAPHERGRYQARCLALLYLFNPMALFILEQSWTDTAAIALLCALWFVLFSVQRHGIGSIILGIVLTTKQYFVLLLPFFLRHKRLKPVHVATTMLTGALLGLPLALWNVRDFLEDAVFYLFRMEPKPESLNLFSFVYHLTGSRLPGAVALLLIPLGIVLFLRQRSSISSLTGACCLVLWIFFFLIKQASLNYLYIVSSFMLLWLACTMTESERAYQSHS